MNFWRVSRYALSLALWSHAASARAAESPTLSRAWAPANSALTVPARRLELALFSGSRYGLARALELSSAPLLFFVLPQAELKWRFQELGSFAFALRARVSYPTPFLRTFSRAGAFGLLPATTDPPQAIELESDALASWSWSEEQVTSLWLGLAVAPHESSEDLPLLDFPFLYPRFAPLYAPAVPRAGISADGRLIGPLFYGVDLRVFVLPLEQVEGAFALEQGLRSELRLNDHLAFDLALRTSYARYPIGLRVHFLPYADVKVGW